MSNSYPIPELDSADVQVFANFIVHFMRHAQPLHKTTAEPDLSIPDPDLSPHGIMQCKEFANSFEPQAKHITHILSCPMTRTLRTALLALSPVIDLGVKIIALPELQNLDSGPSGIGSGARELREKKEWKKYVDWRYMVEEWNKKDDKSKWGAEDVGWRAEYMRGWLRGSCIGMENERREIVVVSHGSFLRKLVEDVKFEDVALRSFRFDKYGLFHELTSKQVEELRSLKINA